MDLHVQAWTQRDKAVKRKVRAVKRMWVSFCRDIFLAPGFPDPEAEMRTRLTLSYAAIKRMLFAPRGDKEAREFSEMRCRLLLAPIA